MKIAILTLPLHTNYGGILQAYALQTVLERMGHTVFLIRKREPEPFNIFKHPYRLIRRTIKKALYWRTTDFLVEKHDYERHQRRFIKFKEFIGNNLHSRDFDTWSEISSWDIDAIVVGSDQIWRPYFFGQDISHAFLDFASGMKIRRIAYAVSFGTDKWEYSKEQTDICRNLVSAFYAVSVREQSAVNLCEQHLCVRPKLVLDPTLLLTEQDYAKLLGPASKVGVKYIMKYCLDNSKEADTISESLVLNGFEISAPVSSDVFWDWKSDLTPFPIDAWLNTIRNAEFIITDSYHCLVFSILFHKNVIVVQNPLRGNARISSLLSILGITDRMVISVDDYHERYQKIMSGMNWSAIDNQLEEYKKSSLNYLIEATS